MTRLRSLLIVLIAIGMPNHVHCILYRLEFADEIKTLQILQDALTEREKKK